MTLIVTRRTYSDGCSVKTVAACTKWLQFSNYVHLWTFKRSSLTGKENIMKKTCMLKKVNTTSSKERPLPSNRSCNWLMVMIAQYFYLIIILITLSTLLVSSSLKFKWLSQINCEGQAARFSDVKINNYITTF